MAIKAIAKLATRCSSTFHSIQICINSASIQVQNTSIRDIRFVAPSVGRTKEQMRTSAKSHNNQRHVMNNGLLSHSLFTSVSLQHCTIFLQHLYTDVQLFYILRPLQNKFRSRPTFIILSHIHTQHPVTCCIQHNVCVFFLNEFNLNDMM